MHASIRCLAALTLLGSSLASQAQSLDKLAWMAGSWTQSKDGETVQESWLGPRGQLMAAVNLTTSAKRGSSFEFLRIVETAAGIAYLASPGGKPVVEFKLKEMGERRVVFENLAHDFPQRVIYWQEADGALRARIEGQMQGRLRGMEWRFEPSAK
ncbi:DUF6265 family protein [Pelomonas sp. SE-A7]|uniref:DUF6265 family protein n=1 Tax=Pelomonas sp. SE-A7 TaxID=3054953 RepID=UPI00259CC5B9|nr:DUF6265 family protein [Pelomonas sp. SE-A7]MDM4765727.1 DUF6265 family protein [Pelomonas sp. SE-A7]